MDLSLSGIRETEAEAEKKSKQAAGLAGHPLPTDNR